MVHQSKKLDTVSSPSLAIAAVNYQSFEEAIKAFRAKIKLITDRHLANALKRLANTLENDFIADTKKKDTQEILEITNDTLNLLINIERVGKDHQLAIDSCQLYFEAAEKADWSSTKYLRLVSTFITILYSLILGSAAVAALFLPSINLFLTTVAFASSVSVTLATNGLFARSNERFERKREVGLSAVLMNGLPIDPSALDSGINALRDKIATISDAKLSNALKMLVNSLENDSFVCTNKEKLSSILQIVCDTNNFLADLEKAGKDRNLAIKHCQQYRAKVDEVGGPSKYRTLVGMVILAVSTLFLVSAAVMACLPVSPLFAPAAVLGSLAGYGVGLGLATSHGSQFRLWSYQRKIAAVAEDLNKAPAPAITFKAP